MTEISIRRHVKDPVLRKPSARFAQDDKYRFVVILSEAKDLYETLGSHIPYFQSRSILVSDCPVKKHDSA